MPRKIDWQSRIGRRLRLRDLHVFFIVAQHGSMAKAAAELGVAPPTVSEAIADLEHGLGLQLLDRSAHGVEPTRYGHALLKRTLIVFDELKQSVRDMEFLADPSVGELRIGCVESVAASILPPIIQRFSRQYPRVVVHVDTLSSSPQNASLRDRKYDVFLNRPMKPLSNDISGNEMKVEFVFDDPLVVAAGSHTQWAGRRKIDLVDLISEPWILPPLDSLYYSRIAKAFKTRGLDPPESSVLTFSVHMRANLLATGQYITILPSSILNLDAARRSLKQLSVDFPVVPWPIAIVTLKNRVLSPVVERFIECTREVAKALSVRQRPRES
jgi:DNA-binding transcriptional LysR family regulator